MSKVVGYIQERMIERLEEAIASGGVAPWQQPWNSIGYRSYATGKEYRGINRFLLPEPGEYITWTQIQKERAVNSSVQLKKGAKKHMVVFWQDYTRVKKESDEAVEDAEEIENEVKKLALRYYNVYNIKDVCGIEGKYVEHENTASTLDVTDVFFEAGLLASDYSDKECPIDTKGQAALYYIDSDKIEVPKLESFISVEEYYSAVFHEMVHSTGHKKRLNRRELYSSNKKTLAVEELVAEMGSYMLMNELGIDTTATQDNSIAYLSGWLKEIQNDINLALVAAQRAQKAFDFILNV